MAALWLGEQRGRGALDAHGNAPDLAFAVTGEDRECHAKLGAALDALTMASGGVRV